MESELIDRDLNQLLLQEECEEKWRLVEYALQNGADPNEICSASGVSPMHLAAGIGERAVQLLLFYGGKANIRASDGGETPLHIAASWGYTKAVIALLKHGADITLKDESENTAYDLAIEGEHLSCANYLKRNGPESPTRSWLYSPNKSKVSQKSSPSNSPLTLTQRLYRYIEEGAPVCLDATSPDTPSVSLKMVRPMHSANFVTSPNTQKKTFSHSSSSSPCKSARFKPHIIPEKVAHCSPLSPSNGYNSCFQVHYPASCLHVSQPFTGFHPDFHGHLPQSSNFICQHALSKCSHLSPCITTNCNDLNCGSQTPLPFCHNSHSPHRGSNTTHEYGCDVAQARLIHIPSQPRNDTSVHGDLSPSLNERRKETQYITQPAHFDFKENYDHILMADNGVKSLSKDISDSGISTEINTNKSSVKSSDSCSLYTEALSSYTTSSQEKVAAYVLSSTDFLSKCTIENTKASKVLSTEDSDTSGNSFTTCSESLCNAVDHGVQEVQEVQSSGLKELVQCKELEMVSNSDHSQSAARSKVLDREETRIQSRWRAPLPHVSSHKLDDLITSESDESFLSSRSPRIYRMKSKVPKVDTKVLNGAKLTHSSNQFLSSMHPSSNNGKKNLWDNFILSADDSIFSTIDVQEPKVPQKERIKPPVAAIDIVKRSKPSSREQLYLPSDDSFLSVIEDKESGIVFIEKYTPSVATESVGRRSLDSFDSQDTIIYDWLAQENLGEQAISHPRFQKFSPKHESGQSVDHKDSSSQHSVGNSTEEADLLTSGASPVIPDHLEKLTCEEISQKLQKYGESPGPVIPSTRQVYLRRLTSLEADPGSVVMTKKAPGYPPEMHQALTGQFDFTHLPCLEAKMVEEFSDSSRQWREGKEKSSFTYLLLDPRVTENLPLRARDLSDLALFKIFISAIFYIGKGKKTRPYCHLHEAVRQIKKESLNTKVSKKCQQVINIWNAGLGVVSLHCFQSVIPVEAYTREACMIEAIGIHKLTNQKRGDFYGVSKNWSMQLRRQIGVFLLKKALQIFLADGERQICLPDIKVSHTNQ